MWRTHLSLEALGLKLEAYGLRRERTAWAGSAVAFPGGAYQSYPVPINYLTPSEDVIHWKQLLACVSIPLPLLIEPGRGFVCVCTHVVRHAPHMHMAKKKKKKQSLRERMRSECLPADFLELSNLRGIYDLMLCCSERLERCALHSHLLCMCSFLYRWSLYVISASGPLYVVLIVIRWVLVCALRMYVYNGI